MRVNFLSQLRHPGALSLFLFIFLIELLFSQGLNRWVVGQGYLRRVLKCGRVREVDSVHRCHPIFRETTPLSLEIDFAAGIFGVSEAHVIECLLAHLHRIF